VPALVTRTWAQKGGERQSRRTRQWCRRTILPPFVLHYQVPTRHFNRGQQTAPSRTCAVIVEMARPVVRLAEDPHGGGEGLRRHVPEMAWRWWTAGASRSSGCPEPQRRWCGDVGPGAVWETGRGRHSGAGSTNGSARADARAAARDLVMAT
jgi:hypothetical protein